MVGNGTLRYSWSSYNPNDVSILFSSRYPPLAGQAGNSAQAELTVSSTIKQGNYTLGLGVDAGKVTVWSLVQVQVTSQSSMVPIETSLTLVVAAAVGLALVVGLILLRTRPRRPPPVQQALPT